MGYNIEYFNPTSRYLRNIDVVKYPNGLKVPSIFSDVKFISDDIESNYTVAPNEAGRLDLVSFKQYGSVDFWWAIAIANYIEFPENAPATGEVLRIPKTESIQRYL